MRLVLILLAVITASAQTGKDARRLLESISKAVRSSDNLRVEGTAIRDVTGEQAVHEETSFVLAVQGPRATTAITTSGLEGLANPE